jgi:hypothetical protein
MNAASTETSYRSTPHTEAHAFPWRLYLAVLFTVVAGHCLFGATYTGLKLILPEWLRVSMTLVVLTAAALYLHAARLEHALNPLSLLIIAVAGFGVFVIGADAYHTLEGLGGRRWLFSVGSGVIFIVALGLAHHWRHELEGGRSLSHLPAEDYIRKKSPIRALILTVSRPDAKKGDDVTVFAPGGEVHARFTSADGKTVDLAGADLGQDIDKLDPLRPNWQQLMRAVQPHLRHGNLKYVVLYGTKASRLEQCAAFMQRYLKGIVPKTLPAIDLERFDEVYDAVSNQVRTLLHDGLLPEEIAVDITGGYKIPSVAGAVLTLNRAVVCQYVQSVGSQAADQNTIAPQIYDLRWDKSLQLTAD